MRVDYIKSDLKYNGFHLTMNPTEKYPHMIQICKGPKSGKHLIGKKYLTKEFAIKAIDEYKVDKMIKSQISSVVRTLESEGYDVDLILESIDN
jgi:hypothetical protein